MLRSESQRAVAHVLTSSGWLARAQADLYLTGNPVAPKVFDAKALAAILEPMVVPSAKRRQLPRVSRAKSACA
jgi:hypothetical protein